MADGSFHELITSIRARLQSELDAQLPALTTRYEEAVSAARTAAEADAEKKWSSTLERHKQDAQRQLESAMAARTEAPDVRALFEAFEAIDSAATASDTLTSIAAAAAIQSSGAAVYVGPDLDAWHGAGSADAPTARQEALATGRTVRKDTGGVAVPLLLDGTPVAVVEADPSSASPERWAETIDLIVRYGAARLAALTAVKMAQAQRCIQPAAAETAPRPSERETNGRADGADEVQSAKRYARLLISEIKLYNETAVHEGRAQRDLARRLAPEIERARRLYEERVSPTVVDRGRHFQHELIHTLAGGDPTLLG